MPILYQTRMKQKTPLLDIDEKIFYEQNDLLLKNRYQYFDHIEQIMMSENPLITHIYYSFEDESFTPSGNMEVVSSTYQLLRITHNHLPQVDRDIYKQEMCKFFSDPLTYTFSGLDSLAKKPSLYLYKLQGSVWDYGIRDGLAMGLLTYNMLNSQFMKEKGIESDDQSEDILIENLSDLEKILDEEGHDGKIIQDFASKSYHRKEVLKAGIGMLRILRSSANKGNDILEKNLKQFNKKPLIYTTTRLERMSRKRPELYQLISENALAKIPNGKNAADLIRLFFRNKEEYYKEMGQEEAMENTFFRLSQDYPHLFELCMLDERNDQEMSSEEETKCTLYPHFFSDSSRFKEYMGSSKFRDIFKLARKYPEHFPGSLEFFSKYRHLSKMYNLKRAFSSLEFYYKLLGNMEPIEEILMLGSLAD